MSRSVAWLLVVMLLGGFGAVAGLLLGERASAGRGMPAYSVYSTERDGLVEAADVLRRLNWEPMAVTRPLPTAGDRGLLVIAEPVASGGEEAEGAGPSEEEARGAGPVGRVGQHLAAVRPAELAPPPAAGDKYERRLRGRRGGDSGRDSGVSRGLHPGLSRGLHPGH